ncbi:MAG: DMT family protein [Alphaproteobacteria bacterium]|nr:DMT family protein [Alphaproteobacteria bacterium]
MAGLGPKERHLAANTVAQFILPIALLSISNVFMTWAWYGHLNHKSWPLWLAVVASWAIAFIEYCFAVPANRYGHAVYSAAELKTIQEVITLLIFCGFSVWVLKEPLTMNHAVGFALIFAGAYVVFRGPLG